MSECPIHTERDETCRHCNAWRIKHDKRMALVCIAAIALGAALPLLFPLNVLQMILAGLSLAVRVPRMLKIK